MARCEYAKTLHIDATQHSNLETTLAPLQSTLRQFQHGSCRVLINYQNTEGKARMLLGDEWKVFPKNDLIQALRQLYGSEAVVVSYS